MNVPQRDGWDWYVSVKDDFDTGKQIIMCDKRENGKTSAFHLTAKDLVELVTRHADYSVQFGLDSHEIGIVTGKHTSGS